ncbi:probable UDP-N-acetylglucosamine--peptide N-acetylglucosaminyltransferase SPINDLY isoform X2 [Malania oleifera]|uniref:probable UDP-N-acetylglucosamine--peptide N-acetylglucosaminyltransferase SPINDLY isoform X2 n=1 Tax=Malania oleifera TaxID=397392 RepID=UPI0025AEBB2A|nr:probable UDP-N-acetylglucosamine--peptide N-acetylglucosaminyltransferase SPINDLY isoform X2 [Malania oleifera]
MSELPERPPPAAAHRRPLPIKLEPSTTDEPSSRPQPLKVVVLADLNVDPPEIDDDDTVHVPAPDIARLINDESSQDKSTLMSKETDTAEGEDADQHCQGAPATREEKVSSLKTGLVHIARKMPKNAHAHFILGLMYQRLCQPQKAVLAYEKAEEILLRSDEEIDRPELLSLVHIHHAQCLLLGSSGDYGSDKELGSEELEEILSKLKESMQEDVRQAAVWNTLGLILLRTGRPQSATSVLSSLLVLAPNNLDCLGNLGIAYLQSGNLGLSERCFQDLILRDQNHPAALINYAALLLCKCGSIVAGAGANADEGASVDHVIAANVAKECLFAAIKMEPKAAHMWANLANAYYLTGDHRSSGKCLEKAAKLEPNCMSARYAVAVHRIKDAERLQDSGEQLSWASNEMASILREGDSALIELPTAWAGFAMVHKAKHEIAAAYKTEPDELMEMEDHALHSLKQAISEDPEDTVQWHQLGLHSLCTQQFKMAQKYLKAAIVRSKDCSYAWSNLGISLQLSEELSQAQEVFKRALSLAMPQQAHAIFSNLGVLCRQQKQYEHAKAMFTKSLVLHPGYAPAYNNLGLVFIAEGQWEEAKFCFNKALQADPLLDAAKSNFIKASAMSRACLAQAYYLSGILFWFLDYSSTSTYILVRLSSNTAIP